MTAKTRADLVAEIARRYGHYHRSTATGGSTTTIVNATGLYEPDDFYVGHYAYIVTDAGGAHAAPEGQERPVTDYDQSDGTLTVSPAFSAAVASGDTYELLAPKRADVTAAINAAIRQAGETWPVPKTDTTMITIADDDYDYSLPSDLVRLLGVMVRGDTDEAWRYVQGRQWWVGGTPGAQVLYFDSLEDLDAGDLVRLDYLARPSELSADSSSLGIGEPAERELYEFVVETSLSWLHQAAAAARAGDFREHLTLAQMAQERAERIRMMAARWQGRGTMRSCRWARARG